MITVTYLYWNVLGAVSRKMFSVWRASQNVLRNLNLVYYLNLDLFDTSWQVQDEFCLSYGKSTPIYSLCYSYKLFSYQFSEKKVTAW